MVSTLAMTARAWGRDEEDTHLPLQRVGWRSPNSWKGANHIKNTEECLCSRSRKGWWKDPELKIN